VLLVQARWIMLGLLKLLQYCYITMLGIHGMDAVLLVQGRREMVDLSAVTAVLLYHIALHTWTDGRFVTSG